LGAVSHFEAAADLGQAYPQELGGRGFGIEGVGHGDDDSGGVAAGFEANGAAFD
jgi:hypothetical protein